MYYHECPYNLNIKLEAVKFLAYIYNLVDRDATYSQLADKLSVTFLQNIPPRTRQSRKGDGDGGGGGGGGRRSGKKHQLELEGDTGDTGNKKARKAGNQHEGQALIEEAGYTVDKVISATVC